MDAPTLMKDGAAHAVPLLPPVDLPQDAPPIWLVTDVVSNGQF